MLPKILKSLATTLTSTITSHKKKLIFIFILIIGYKIARRKLKPQNLIQFILYFMKIGNKILEFLPLPIDSQYRQIQPFQYIGQIETLQMRSVINIKQLLTKVKNKQQNSLDQLKISVFSTVILNIVIKYKTDFIALDAGQQFHQALLITMKNDHIKNLNSFRSYIVNQIGSQIFKISLSQVVNIRDIRTMFENIVNRLYKQVMDISEKVLTRKTQVQQTKEYKIANNYFRTTKQYIEQSSRNSNKLLNSFKIITTPVRFLYKGLQTLLQTPQQVLTTQRYQINQFLYILPLKKYKNSTNWPSLQSKYLFGMVIQEIIQFFYSINFNIVSKKSCQLNLNIFVNRVNIYFMKKVKCQSKKIMDLLPIFFKIIQEEFVNNQKRKDFYQRELFNAFRDTKYNPNSNINISQQNTKITMIQNKNPSDYKLRNSILKQIYLKNQLQHLEKDMQAKLYNQRQGLVIEPRVKNISGVAQEESYGGKDQIQQLMELHQHADVQKDTPNEQMRMMRQLI